MPENPAIVTFRKGEEENYDAITLEERRKTFETLLCWEGFDHKSIGCVVILIIQAAFTKICNYTIIIIYNLR